MPDQVNEDGNKEWMKGWVPSEHKSSFGPRATSSSPVLGAPYGAEPSIRSCNRHSNCEEANKKWLSEHPGESSAPWSFHCHNDECEDCFGC
jgi:hypothetical protein